MKRLIYAVMLTVFLLPPIAVAKSALLMTDGPLTAIGVLKGRTDENGYLRVSGGTPGATDGPLTAIGNLKGRTDENGYLRVALAGGTMTSALTIQVDAIGATSTDGLRLKNATAAAAGAQQFSPRTCWEGQGWKTDATAASQSVVFCAETQPVQGTSAPTGNWILKASINGGAFSTVGTFNSGGAVTFASTIEAGGGIFTASTAYIGSASRGFWRFPADGIAVWRNNAEGNTFSTAVDDAKTLLSGEAVSYAQDATGNLGVPIGLLTVTIGTENKTCVYILSETATTELSDPGSICTVTKDGAATVNIYWDTNAFFIQNKIAGTRAIRAVLIGG